MIKDFTDRVPSEGQANKKQIIFDDGTIKYAKIINADGPINDGTPLNRATFMAMQGMQAINFTFNSDGSITEIDPDGGKLITKRDSEGNIIEEFTNSAKSFERVLKLTVDGFYSEVTP